MIAAPLVRSLALTGKPSIKLSAAQSIALGKFRERLNQGVYGLAEAICACGADDDADILVAAQERYGLPIQTYICSACGILYSTPRMSGEGLTRFYRDEYRALYFDQPTATERFFARQVSEGDVILSRVASHFDAEPARTVFDIGCGAGGTLKPFQDAGCQVVGCDFGEAYLEFGRDNGMTLLTGDCEVLAGLGKADLLIARHVLEHLSDPHAQLTAWRHLTKEDGLVYVEVPGLYRAYRDYRGMHEFLHVAHTHHFTLETLGDLAARTGLELLAGDQSVWALFRLAEPRAGFDNQAAVVERFLRFQESPAGRVVRRAARLGRKLKRMAG